MESSHIIYTELFSIAQQFFPPLRHMAKKMMINVIKKMIIKVSSRIHAFELYETTRDI